MSSFTSKEAEDIIKSRATGRDFVTYTSRQVARVFNDDDSGSSASDPLLLWGAGCQLVSLDLDAPGDESAELARCWFQVSNGGCGYVLKPDYLRKPTVRYWPTAPSELGLEVAPPCQVTITILSGQHLPRPRYMSSLGFRRARKTHPAVRVALLGHPEDRRVIGTTPASRDNSSCPCWDEGGGGGGGGGGGKNSFTFIVRLPHLAFLKLQLVDVAPAAGAGAASSSVPSAPPELPPVLSGQPPSASEEGGGATRAREPPELPPLLVGPPRGPDSVHLMQRLAGGSGHRHSHSSPRTENPDSHQSPAPEVKTITISSRQPSPPPAPRPAKSPPPRRKGKKKKPPASAPAPKRASASPPPPQTAAGPHPPPPPPPPPPAFGLKSKVPVSREPPLRNAPAASPPPTPAAANFLAASTPATAAKSSSSSSSAPPPILLGSFVAPLPHLEQGFRRVPLHSPGGGGGGSLYPAFLLVHLSVREVPPPAGGK